jgi:CMP-N,N'-diacetyllegionaminic acid synthase
MTLVYGLITARGGSKGIPGKNIKPLAGKPLIAYTIEAALRSRKLARTLFSTDDEGIAAVARKHGAEVPFIRPSDLAGDDSSHISVVEHALHWLEKHENVRPDYLMLLQPTCPFRTTADIDAACDLAEARKPRAVVSVTESHSHPYLAKSIAADGTLKNFMSHDLKYERRQDLPRAYSLNGAIYLNRRESLLEERVFVPPGTLPYVMPRERSMDIDSLWDWQVAEWVLEHGDAATRH